MSVDIRETYNLKKIQKFNNIDQTHNMDQLKDVIIKSEKIQKPNININNLVKSKEEENNKVLNESIKKRTNQPYKGIIKNFDYSKIREKHEEDLIVHKNTDADKDKKVFDSKLNNYNNTIQNQNTEIKQIYSGDKYTVNKKDFDDTKEVLDFKPYMAIKDKFIEDKKNFFTISRDIELESKFQNIYEKLFSRQNVITIEIWFGFALFITKHFNVSIDKIMEFFNKKIPEPYLVQKDTFGDIVTPMAKYVYKKLSGGNISFYEKYLKYKNKYLLAKKNIQ